MEHARTHHRTSIAAALATAPWQEHWHCFCHLTSAMANPIDIYGYIMIHYIVSYTYNEHYHVLMHTYMIYVAKKNTSSLAGVSINNWKKGEQRNTHTHIYIYILYIYMYTDILYIYCIYIYRMAVKKRNMAYKNKNMVYPEFKMPSLLSFRSMMKLQTWEIWRNSIWGISL